MSNRKTIVITGAAGFIGSNIARALSKQGEFDLIVVDYPLDEDKKKNLEGVKYKEYVSPDDFLIILSEDKLSDIEAIIHMGACTDTTETNEEYIIENNTEYSKKLFEYCLNKKVRLIYASSAATYGDGSMGFSDNERNLEQLNLYGKSKYLFDEYVLDSTVKPEQWVGLKFFNVYGPYEDHKKRMASMALHSYNQAIKNSGIKLFSASKPGYSDGGEKRDFIYIEDVVKVVMFFLNNPRISGIYNVGTGKPRIFLDLAKAVFLAINKEPKISFFPMPEDLKGKYQYFTQADISKLREAGYKENFIGLEEGVKDYIKSYLSIK